MKEASFADPFLLLHQFAMHDRDLSSGSSEADESKFQPEPEGFPKVGMPRALWSSVIDVSCQRFHHLLNCAYKASKHSNPFARISWSLRPCLAQPLKSCSIPK